MDAWVVEERYEKGRIFPSCWREDDILVFVETEEGFVGSVINFQRDELVDSHLFTTRVSVCK